MLAEAVPLVDVPTQSAAPQASSDEVPVPPQYQQARVNDFRGAGFAPKGYKQNAVKTGSSKRKLDEYQQQVQFQCKHGQYHKGCCWCKTCNMCAACKLRWTVTRQR